MRYWVDMHDDVCVVCFMFNRRRERRSSTLADLLVSSDVCGSRVFALLSWHHLICHSFDVGVFVRIFKGSVRPGVLRLPPDSCGCRVVVVDWKV